MHGVNWRKFYFKPVRGLIFNVATHWDAQTLVPSTLLHGGRFGQFETLRIKTAAIASEKSPLRLACLLRVIIYFWCLNLRNLRLNFRRVIWSLRNLGWRGTVTVMKWTIFKSIACYLIDSLIRFKLFFSDDLQRRHSCAPWATIWANFLLILVRL